MYHINTCNLAGAPVLICLQLDVTLLLPLLLSSSVLRSMLPALLTSRFRAFRAQLFATYLETRPLSQKTAKEKELLIQCNCCSWATQGDNPEAACLEASSQHFSYTKAHTESILHYQQIIWSGRDLRPLTYFQVRFREISYKWSLQKILGSDAIQSHFPLVEMAGHSSVNMATQKVVCGHRIILLPTQSAIWRAEGLIFCVPLKQRSNQPISTAGIQSRRED